jgi:hypothetical protein
LFGGSYAGSVRFLIHPDDVENREKEIMWKH